MRITDIFQFDEQLGKIKFEGEVMKLTKRNITILFLSLAMICAVTFSARFIKYIDITTYKIVAKVFLSLSSGFIALIAMKLTDMKIEIDLRNKHQYLIGIAIALGLSVVIAVIPALCGFSLIGNHEDFSWFVLIYDLLFYLLIIGPVEEFVFRVYLQDAFVSFFEKNKWLGVVIASFLFGLWHIINGSIIQVLFAFGIGLVFGFAKYKIKNCGYAGLAFAHGLYDFCCFVGATWAVLLLYGFVIFMYIYCFGKIKSFSKADVSSKAYATALVIRKYPHLKEVLENAAAQPSPEVELPEEHI